MNGAAWSFRKWLELGPIQRLAAPSIERASGAPPRLARARTHTSRSSSPRAWGATAPLASSVLFADTACAGAPAHARAGAGVDDGGMGTGCS